VVCELDGDLAMVPLTGRLSAELVARLGDEAARLDAAETYRAGPLPSYREGLRRWVTEASRGTAVALVSTGEFGDTSYEYVTLWADGEQALSGGGLRAVYAWFRDHAGLDFDERKVDLEIYRGEDAAEKWAAAALKERGS
jgi:hypothetical protein